MANPFKTLLALDHFDDQLSLDRLVVLDDVGLELLVASTNLSNHIVSLLLQMDLVDTNKEQTSFNVNNRNRNVQFLDQLFDLHINSVVLFVIELDWRLIEKHMALFLDLSVGHSSIFCLRNDEMLIEGIVINLLLSDSSNHLFLFHIQVSQVRHKLDFFVIAEFEKSFSLFLFSSSSFFDFFVLLVLHHVGFRSFSSEIFLPSLPKSLFFSLSDDVQSSSLSFNNELALLHHDVIVLGSSSCKG